MSADSRQHQSV